jgi:hypothetical protein
VSIESSLRDRLSHQCHIHLTYLLSRRRTDKDGPDGKRQTLLIDIGLILVIEHTVKLRNVSVLITNDWEFKVTTSEVINVLDPSVVGVYVVCGETDELID